MNLHTSGSMVFASSVSTARSLARYLSSLSPTALAALAIHPQPARDAPEVGEGGDGPLRLALVHAVLGGCISR
jgi:hypothetical protein